MKSIWKILILAFAINLSDQLIIGQKASDVLENGIQVKSDERLFLAFDGKVLKYTLVKKSSGYILSS